jgi:CBS domain-containing protein
MLNLKQRKMKRRTPISAIMTRDVITLNTSNSLETAEHLFKTNHIRHIPVVSGDVIKGMLSYTDLLRISFADAIDESDESVDTIVYNMFTIEQVMAKSLVSIASSTLIKEVAEILAKKEFHALPVVDDNKLVGIVTTTDLINYLIDQF